MTPGHIHLQVLPAEHTIAVWCKLRRPADLHPFSSLLSSDHDKWLTVRDYHNGNYNSYDNACGNDYQMTVVIDQW